MNTPTLLQFKKLLEVADIVDATPIQKFSMETWWCGTYGCAVGNYCAKHPRANLKIVYSGNRSSPRFGNLGDMYAVAAYFGIAPEEAFSLFNSDAYQNPKIINWHYTTRRQVSARIRNFVKKHSIAKATSPEAK